MTGLRRIKCKICLNTLLIPRTRNVIKYCSPTCRKQGQLQISRINHQKRKEQEKLEFKNWVERNQELRREYMKQYRKLHRFQLNRYLQSWKFKKKQEVGQY